jgi:hypothetical protein
MMKLSFPCQGGRFKLPHSSPGEHLATPQHMRPSKTIGVVNRNGVRVNELFLTHAD